VHSLKLERESVSRGVSDQADLSVVGIGVDFGTSNSVIGLLRADGSVVFAQFADRGERFTTLPSVLCLSPSEDPAHPGTRRVAGFAAIEEYLYDPSRSRLLQSLKSYLGARTFDRTQVGAESFNLPQLISAFLDGLFQQAELTPRANGVPVVCGRPVKFAGKDPDDSLAEARLREAYEMTGVGARAFRTEAEAAAYAYSRTSRGNHFALIADLGGGTSDFSVVRISGEGSQRLTEPLSQTGIAVAGDTFDARTAEQIVAPALGLCGHYRPLDKWLPMPKWIAGELAMRHRVAALRTPKMLRLLREIGSKSDQPEAFAGLIRIAGQGLGYQLFAAIAALKVSLSSSEQATFRFHDGLAEIVRVVSRAEFETWIRADVEAIEATAQRAVELAGVDAAAISVVFLTGGSSLVPLVQQRFRRRFASSQFVSNDNFASVAHGLALMAAEYG
jgi:hypothetical chaperone protein